MTYKHCLIVASLILCVAVILGIATRARTAIAKMDARFSQIAVGQRARDVPVIMGREITRRTGGAMFIPKDERGAPDAFRARCAFEYEYRVDTFYLPVSWIICVDTNDVVIAKMRLD